MDGAAPSLAGVVMDLLSRPLPDRRWRAWFMVPAIVGAFSCAAALLGFGVVIGGAAAIHVVARWWPL